jgi:hypothetical protein
MAVLMGSVPPGLTFQDLVGGPAPHASTTPEHSGSDSATQQDQLMRINLPNDVVRETTSTQYREFLVSYRFVQATGDAVVESRLRGALEKGHQAPVEAVCG